MENPVCTLVVFVLDRNYILSSCYLQIYFHTRYGRTFLLKNKHHASFSPRYKLYIIGSGKSTLLNIITGRRKCDSGSITVDGKPIDRQLRRWFGYVLQNDVFFTNLTLWQTLYVSLCHIFR